MAGPPPSSSPSPWRDRNLRRWLGAYTLSLVGDGAFFLTLSWTARELAGPSRVGLVLAAAALPRAVLMLVGGVLVDRLGPRRVVLVSDTGRLALVAALAGALALARPGWWVLVAVAVVYGVVDALFLPAVATLPSRLVGDDQSAKVQGLRSLAIRAGDTLGPPAGGAVLALGGSATAFGVIAAGLAVSLALLVTVRVRAPAIAPAGAAGAWHSLIAGLRYVRAHPTLRVLLLSLVLTELGGVPILNLGVVLLADRRGWGPAGAGWLVGAFGLGAAASAAVLATIRRPAREGRVYVATLAAAAVMFGGLGAAPGLAAGAGIAAVAGAAFGLTGALVFVLAQDLTAPDHLGRVMSLVYLAAFGLAPVSFPAFNALADRIGITAAIAAGAGVTLCGAGVAALRLLRT